MTAQIQYVNLGIFDEFISICIITWFCTVGNVLLPEPTSYTSLN